jgi:hypothetical protein
VAVTVLRNRERIKLPLNIRENVRMPYYQAITRLFARIFIPFFVWFFSSLMLNTDSLLAAVGDPILLGIDSRQNESLIFVIDPDTGIAEVRREISFGQVLGIAFDPVSNHLFGSKTFYGLDGKPERDARLIDVSRDKIVGPFGFGNVQDLAFDLEGNLFAVESPRIFPFPPVNPESVLLKIDKTTGKAMPIGNIGEGSVTALTFDSLGVLYGVVLKRVEVGGLLMLQEDLLLIDTTTGEASMVGTIGRGSSLLHIGGIAFGEGDKLFGVSDRDDTLISIDVTTAQPTVLGSLGSGIGNPQGLTTLTGLEIPPPQAILNCQQTIARAGKSFLQQILTVLQRCLIGQLTGKIPYAVDCRGIPTSDKTTDAALSRATVQLRQTLDRGCGGIDLENLGFPGRCPVPDGPHFLVADLQQCIQNTHMEQAIEILYQEFPVL